MPAPPPIRVARDPLVAFTCVLVILAVVGHAFESARQFIAAAAAGATQGASAGNIEQNASTSALGAHLTFTNLNAFDAEACVRGVITPKRGDEKIYSVPVCTGVMKPRSTVVLDAPYKIGAVDDLCSGTTDSIGIRRLDWSRCTFDVEPATGHLSPR